MGKPRSPWRRLLALALILPAIGACGGKGGSQLLTDLTAPDAALLPAPELPALPSPMTDPQPGRRIALANNILYGSEYWDCSESSARVVGDSLELSAVETATAWGVWAWGEFPGDVLPIQLRVELTLAEGNEYWLLLPDFTRGRWRTLGPYTDAMLVMDYEDPASSISQAGWTYIAIVACEGSEVLVDRLNLIADQRVLPLPGPREVHVEQLGASWARLAWTPPQDMLPLGYRVFLGPHANFELDDEGVEMMHSGLVEDTSFRIEGLLCETEYHCRVHAYYLGSQFSRLSNTATFTTTDSLPPEVSFRWYPEAGQVDLPIFFNPSDTTDADTPQDELVFKWDFDDDDEIDVETEGPVTVEHSFDHRGLMPVTLTVFDGRDTSLTQGVKVSFRYEYYRTSFATGIEPHVVAVDADREGGRIAVLIEQNDQYLVRYKQGSEWQTIPVEGLSPPIFSDIALTPDGVSLLLIDYFDGAVDWWMFEYDGLTWTEEHTGHVPEEIRIGEDGPYWLPHLAYWGGLDVASNGRICVGMITGVVVWPNVEMYMYVWHELADGTFIDNTDDSDDPRPAYLGYDGEWPGAARRSDSTSYFIYSSKNVGGATNGGKWMLWQFTDGGDSLEVLRDDSDKVTVTHFATDLDPASEQLCWAAATSEQRIYYGDNYGVPASGQYYDLATGITGLIGISSSGDNEALFYWTDEVDENDTQHLWGYDTTGAGQQYETLSGIGVADVGYGGTYTQDAELGVCAVVDEFRDGECTAHFLATGELRTSECVCSEAGTCGIFKKHLPLLFDDGTLMCLSEQRFATARAAIAPEPGEPFSITDVGIDTWCIPDAACITAVPGEYLVASYTWRELGAPVQLNRYNLGNPTGQSEGIFAGVKTPQLRYNRATGEVLFCYFTDTQQIEVRTWAASAWSLPSVIYEAPADHTIETINVVGNPLGGWGVACLTEQIEEIIPGIEEITYHLWLIEKSGFWRPSEEILSEPINGSAQVGIDYNTAGALCVAVELDTAPTEVCLGVRSDSVDWTWTTVATSTGELNTFSIFASYYADSPLVMYYQKRDESESKGDPVTPSRVVVAEEFEGSWYTVELPFQMHGSPLGYARDDDGNFILTGYSMTANPHRAVVAILYE